MICLFKTYDGALGSGHRSSTTAQAKEQCGDLNDSFSRIGCPNSASNWLFVVGSAQVNQWQHALNSSYTWSTRCALGFNDMLMKTHFLLILGVTERMLSIRSRNLMSPSHVELR
jgi:hypothetical protein